MMTQAGGRTNAVLSKLTLIGDLLMLQLVFLVLQRRHHHAVSRPRSRCSGCCRTRSRQERSGPAAAVLPAVRLGVRRFWLSGLGLYFGGVALAFGLAFWAYADGPVRIFALAMLIPLTGMILGLYLSGLAVLPDAADDATMKTLFRSANLFLLRRSLPVAGGVIGSAHLVRAGVAGADTAS